MPMAMDPYRGEMMPPGLMKVVEGHELEAFTMMGWRLVQVLDETELTTCSEMVPLVNPNGNYPSTYGGTRGFTVQKSRFLIFLDERSAVKQANALKDGAITELRAMEQKLREMDKAQKETDGKALRMELENRRLETEIARIAGQSADNRRIKEKMETDLGKVRTAVGDLRMKEILG